MDARFSILKTSEKKIIFNSVFIPVDSNLMSLPRRHQIVNWVNIKVLYWVFQYRYLVLLATYNYTVHV